MKDFWADIRYANWTQRFVWLNVALFVAGALTVPKLASVTYTLLALIGVILLVRERWPQDLTQAEKWLLAAFALYFIIGAVSYNLGIKTRLGWEIIFRDIRLLFAIPVYLILRRYPPPRWLFWLTLGVGALAILGVALTDYLGKIGSWRASGATISIVFGHLCATMALVCASGAVFLRGRWQGLLLACSLLAVGIAIILSGTRGAWLALLGSGGFLLLFWWWRTGWRQRLLSVVILIIFSAATSVWLYQPILDRFQKALKQWTEYQAIQEQLSGLDLPLTGCINHSDFLAVYAAQFRPGKRDLMQIEIVPDDIIGSYACPTNRVVRLHNPGPERAWISLPERAITKINKGPARATWLVRGRGFVQFSGTRESRIRIKNKTWERLELDFPRVNSPAALTFILRERETLYLVPVQITPGEYTNFYTGSSIGSRLQMWEAAWQVFLAHPLLGAGTGAWQESTMGLVQSGKVSAVVTRYDHAHNDYLTALADRGLAGLTGLLLLYGAPLWLFAGVLRRRTVNGPEPAAVAGLLVVGGFMLSGLTETLFNHSLVITYYAVFISLLAVLSRQAPAKESS